MCQRGGCDEFSHCLETLRLQDDALAAGPGRLRNVPPVRCGHEGQPVRVDRHLKESKCLEPRESMRTCCPWDEACPTVVVEHPTTHLVSEIR